MNSLEIVLLVLVIVVVVVLVVALIILIPRLNKGNGKNSEQSNSGITAGDLSIFQQSITDSVKDAMGEVKQKVQDMSDNMELKLQDNGKSVNDSINVMDKKIQSVNEAQEKLSGLDSHILNLQKVLDNNQTRGQYGEYQLETLLENVFGGNPSIYALQYEIRVNDEKKVRPDAVVFLNNDLLLCIDSKFPYQAYQRYVDASSESEKKSELASFIRDVKTRIDEIGSKYIIEGITYPSAIMFIPNDGIYAFISSDVTELMDYAYKAHVSFASPSIFIPVLANIGMIKIEEMRSENVEYLTEQIRQLSSEFKKFNDAWKKVNGSINSLNTNKGTLNTSVKKLNNHFAQIEKSDVTSLEGPRNALSNAEPINLEGPDDDDPDENIDEEEE